MNNTLFIFLILIVAPLFCAAQVQSRQLPIEKLINPKQLTETFIYMSNDLYVMAPDSANNRKVIRAFHTPLNPNPGNHLNYDNDILDGNTLRPLSKQTSFGSVFYDYSKWGEVQLTFIKEKDTTRRSVKIDQYTFNLRGPAALVLAACLPLQLGFSTNFSVMQVDFPYEQNFDVRLVNYRLNVLGEETISIRNRKFPTYIVEIDSRNDTTGVYYKSWVTKQAPHMAIQLIYQLKKGNKNYKTAKPFVVRDIFFDFSPSTQ